MLQLAQRKYENKCIGKGSYVFSYYDYEIAECEWEKCKGLGIAEFTECQVWNDRRYEYKDQYENIHVKITNSKTLKYPNKGNQSIYGNYGDLIIKLILKPHEKYELKFKNK